MKIMNPITFKPTITTDGGPWAKHDMPCCVLQEIAPAVLNIDENVFEPSWQAQEQGWQLVRVKSKWQKFVLKIIGVTINGD